MDNNWLRKEITNENDVIIELINDPDMYEYICNDDEDYYMVAPNEWEKAYKKFKKNRNQKKEMQIENKLWEQSSKLIQLGYEALGRKEIDEAIVLFEESVLLKSKSNSPYYELSRIYKKRHDTENEIRICKIASERLPTLLQYSKRVRELEGTQPRMKTPCKRQKIVIKETSFGDNLYNLWNSFSEDDFYIQDVWDVEEDCELEEVHFESDILEKCIDDSYHYNRLPKLALKEDKLISLCDYYDYMYNASKNVKEAIAMDDYCKAIDIQERLLAEEVPYYDYYESLRKFYQKFRLREAELGMLKDVMKLIEKDTKRYRELTNKLMSWFPNTDFSANHPYVEHGICIYKQRSGQIKKWKERIIWLEERVNKKTKK